jgi:hypothetical protein
MHSELQMFMHSELRTAEVARCSACALHLCICLQNVTLGGTGKEVGDRHPKIAANVLIGAGASILGNISVGIGAQVAAGSLVLKPVEPHTMVAGSPAQHIGAVIGNPAASLNQWSEDCPLSTGELDDRRPTSVPTRSGGRVHVYGEGDYYRHVDAERLLFSKDAAKDLDAVPPEWPYMHAADAESTGSSRGQPESEVVATLEDKDAAEGAAKRHSADNPQDIDSHLKPFQAAVDTSHVAATTSDEVAQKLWGDQPNNELEFFI